MTFSFAGTEFNNFQSSFRLNVNPQMKTVLYLLKSTIWRWPIHRLRFFRKRWPSDVVAVCHSPETFLRFRTTLFKPKNKNKTRFLYCFLYQDSIENDQNLFVNSPISVKEFFCHPHNFLLQIVTDNFFTKRELREYTKRDIYCLICKINRNPSKIDSPSPSVVSLFLSLSLSLSPRLPRIILEIKTLTYTYFTQDDGTFLGTLYKFSLLVLRKFIGPSKEKYRTYPATSKILYWSLRKNFTDGINPGREKFFY